MSALYDLGRQAFLEGNIDWLNDTIQVVLISNNYIPSLSNDQYLIDLGNNLITTAQTLSNKSTTAGVADAGDVVFPNVSSGQTAQYVVIYKFITNISDSPLIALIDVATGLPTTTTGNNVNILWDNGTNRIFKL